METLRLIREWDKKYPKPMVYHNKKGLVEA